MKKLLLILILALPFAGYAQNCNPFVAQALVTNSPLPDLQNGGQGTLSFNVGNSGSDPMPVSPGNAMIVVVSLSNGIPSDTTTPVNSLGGTFKNIFSWSYNATTNSYTGVQSTNIPAAQSGGVGTITIDYTVTANSAQSNPQNGFNVNVTPPPFLVGINGTGDDFVSSFTWTTNTVLPVNLSSFDAHAENCDVRLNWKANEISNFKHFSIERSLDNEFEFNEIAIKKSQAESESYTYLDTKIEKGATYYYRLKMIDRDESFALSNVIQVDAACDKKIRYSVVPNPTSTSFKLNELTDVKAVKLYDAFGKLIIAKSYKELNQYPLLSVSNLAPGLYMMTVENKKGKIQGLKLMVD